ncbi:septal ring lytic transglycosylase RlpA family protein [Adhaeribacter sp. BT258]|uniref:Probable endolytic peptidoglycan transglycosylase RlpA n=1 Tax=Adhaeribacter terrigena TaxID=2793070 RepID=A0ABS1C3N6_9BACT|nr:septal ring lytic transglycosylase RlpA family protein [Adhaeribacter terrigena]MBK0403160.1 septal ring lytic transglycosylase RlpA family protein [Adhaeribacter terrigena]
MDLRRLNYVFSFILIIFFALNISAFATGKGKTQTGTASWYGTKYHGRKSSNGEVYNKNKLTAAHPSLPFGTQVKVTNLANNQSVIVRITDRGPFKGRRLIDLSEAAARKIDMIRSGTAKVEMEILSQPASEVATTAALPDSVLAEVYYVIQAGSFADLKNAELQSQKIKALQNDMQVTLTQENVNGKTVHRVLAGRFNDRQLADRVKDELSKAGIPTLVRQGNG